jgi:hypothetical protein
MTRAQRTVDVDRIRVRPVALDFLEHGHAGSRDTQSSFPEPCGDIPGPAAVRHDTTQL